MVELGRKEVVGVDIGSYAVKVVQLRRAGKGFSVHAGAIVEIDEKGAPTASRHEANTIRAILTCLRIAGVKTNYAACSLGGPDVAIRNFDFPVLPDDELNTAVLFEARQVCPFTTPDIAVDYRLIPNGGERSKGYLVAATNKCVRDTARLARKARLNCALMDVDALAILNCFSEVEKPGPEHGTAILNIGSNHTTMVIEGSGGWPFVRNLNYCGNEVIKQIAGQRDVSTDSVKKMLIDPSQELPEEVHELLAKATDGFVSDIEKTLLYYSTQENSFDIQKILVCGGAALYKGIVGLLNNMLPVEVELWNPFEKMRCHGWRNHKGVLLKNILKKKGPAMVIAAGLAMRTI